MEIEQEKLGPIENPLHITFTGAGSTGKSTYSQFVSELVSKEIGPVITLPSATRRVLALTGWDAEGPDNDELQLYSAFQRVLWEYEYKDEHVISERCGLDELAYQRVRTSRLERKVANPTILVPSQQGQTVTEDQTLLHLAGGSLQVLLQQGMVEADKYWDFIYYCPPHGSIEEDGQRPTDPDYHKEVVEAFEWILKSFPHLNNKLTRLPENMDDAKQLLDGEVEKWKQRLLAIVRT